MGSGKSEQVWFDGRRMLVVDDSLTQATVLVELLQGEGFAAEMARSGAEALAMFSPDRFDLILTDVHMPGMSGLELCEHLKSDPNTRDIPVILITSLDRPEDILAGLRAGADNFVAKPFEHGLLLDRVRGLLASTDSRDPSGEGDPTLSEDSLSFLGETFEVRSSTQVVNYLASTFEGFLRARAAARRSRVEAEGLRRSERFLQSTLDALSAYIGILDASGALMAVNAQWRDFEADHPLIGPSHELNSPWLQRCEKTTGPNAFQFARVGRELWSLLGREGAPVDMEFPCEAPGGLRWFRLRARSLDEHKPPRVVLGFEDISDLKEAERKLQHDAHHDSLTGLPNRALFMERLARTLARNKRTGRPFAVLFLDLDRFKVVNDSLGHEVGDKLLVEVSRRILRCLRDNDTAARLGGDEFAVLLDDVQGGSEVLPVVERISQELSPPVRLDRRVVRATASVGIATSETKYTSAVEILRDADTAMYRAKAGNRPYAIFDEKMHAQAVARLELESDLGRAIEREEFVVYFQPIVELPSGRGVGAEALIRWNHPERGLVSPMDFIPFAEETGHIVPIGRWVLRRSCQELATWRTRRGDLGVSVNMSGRQFEDGGLIDVVRDVLTETGLPGSALTLEVTETTVLSQPNAVREQIDALRALGVRFAMDDFGTGYSSLNTLRTLPFDALKIDRSFVDAITGDGPDRKIVANVLSLAEILDMAVVAEGVETAAQGSLLHEMGCRLAQGYHFARPMLSEQLQALWAEQS